MSSKTAHRCRCPRNIIVFQKEFRDSFKILATDGYRVEMNGSYGNLRVSI